MLDMPSISNLAITALKEILSFYIDKAELELNLNHFGYLSYVQLFLLPSSYSGTQMKWLRFASFSFCAALWMMKLFLISRQAVQG